MNVDYSYLQEQFSNPEAILNDIRELVRSGEFTLGKRVEDFEQKFARVCQAKYAVGVGSGTDALRLSLIALGIGPGDEVITTPFTFFATVGAIATIGAKAVFVDVSDDYNIDVSKIESAITLRTKALLPVHWHGCPAEMDTIMDLARRYRLYVVEDACMAIGAEFQGKRVGSWGDTGCFSLHPLKPLNVWGDGGMIVTNSAEIKDRLLLLRNHGLVNRNECALYAYNSRLDPLQAIVGGHLIHDIERIVEAKIRNAARYDAAFTKIPQLKVPPRDHNKKQVYHNYVLLAEHRDELVQYLLRQGIDAKIHYPLPLHLQKASERWGYTRDDFPVAEYQAGQVLSLPVHQHLTLEQVDYVIAKVNEFYVPKTTL